MSKKKKQKEIITYKYRFRFADKSEKRFIVKLDNETLNLMNKKFKRYPAWARLENFKCSICPLDSNKVKFCPVVVHLAGIIEQFRDSISYEMVDVEIKSGTRTYIKHTSLQEGINSLIGIFMVTSGCPVLEMLKPMVRIHLPFSTLKERKYRVLTMYLLSQFFINKWGGKPDWDFKELVDIFNDVRIINKNFCKKLSEISVKDATINALVSLDAFAFYTTFHIIENMLNVLEPSFYAYLSKYERRKRRRKA